MAPKVAGSSPVSHPTTLIDIELDGKQHEIIDGIPVLEDLRRAQFLKNAGWTVLRFPNYRPLSDMNNVIAEILGQLIDPASLSKVK